ncbi:MAG: hypothetical protein WEC12_01765 [Balneolaceae bacterium]
MTEELVWVFLLNTACSLILTGIIWFMQIVYYPVLPRLYRAEFKRHHRFIVSRSVFIAGPFMAGELISSIYLASNAEQFFLYHLGGLIIVAILWLSTFFIQLPAHFRLNKGYNEEFVKKLTDTNWLRTILWSAKSLISLQALFQLTSS